MGALFGTSAWLAHAPEASKGAWAEILGERTGEDLHRGLRKLRENPPKFPPGAAAFNAMCRVFQPGTFAGAATPAPLPSVAKLLEGATVSGDARAYIDLCKKLTEGERLTRAQLEGLPPCYLPGGDMIWPADFCTAADDQP